jgi:heat shock protein HslJ
MIHQSKTLAAGLLIAASLIALAGCSSGSGSLGSGSADVSPLDGTQWRLTEWTLSSLSPTDFTITAAFANGQISGSSGVNTYSGQCKLGPGAAFSAGPLASTQMAGPEPAMRAETAYLTLLGQAQSYKTAAGRLTLFDKGGNESLFFEAAGK